MSTDKIILTTTHFIVREFTVEDANFIIELLNSDGWLKYIGDRQIRSVADAKNYLEQGTIKSYQDHGYGLYLVQHKETLQAIGMCGFVKREYLEHPDIGFAFLPEHTRKGYGFKVANALLHFAQQSLDLPVVFAITLPQNKPSIKLIEKIGMHYVRSFAPKDETLLLYSTIKEST